MGFGILLLGYFLSFAFFISQIYFFADIIGAGIMIYSFIKLNEYNTYFRVSAVLCGLYIIFCGVDAASILIPGLYEINSVPDIIIEILKSVTSCVMLVFAFLGIMGLAGESGASKIRLRAKRNLVVTVFTCAVAIASSFILPVIPQEAYPYVVIWLYVLRYFTIFLNLLLFYSCFATFVPEGVDDEEIKPSRFKIVNKFNEKFDELEAKKDAYRRESVRLALEEAEKRHNSGKKNGKKHKKK